MRTQILILFTFILAFSQTSFAQGGPGGINAGLRLWLDASDTSTMFTDAACTPGNEVTTKGQVVQCWNCLLYTSPSPRDKRQSRMPSSA